MDIHILSNGKSLKPVERYEICWTLQVSIYNQGRRFIVLLTLNTALGGYAEAQSRICDIRERYLPLDNVVPG
jgi:hypothetical protein